MEQIVYRVGKTLPEGVNDPSWRFNLATSSAREAAAQYGHALLVETDISETRLPDHYQVGNLVPNSDDSLSVKRNDGTVYWCAASLSWTGPDAPPDWDVYYTEYKKYTEALGHTFPEPDWRDVSFYEDFVNWQHNGKPLDWATRRPESITVTEEVADQPNVEA